MENDTISLWPFLLLLKKITGNGIYRSSYSDITNETKGQSDQANCPVGLGHDHGWERLDKV